MINARNTKILSKKYINLTGFIALCSLLFLSPLAWAGYQFYATDLDDAKWVTNGNRLECRLNQIVPGYGKATFRQRALHAMDFTISTLHVPRLSGQAMIFIRSPSWKGFTKKIVLGRVPVSAQKQVITVPQDWAYRIAMELREGMEAVWTHPDWADAEDLVIAKVLPLYFEKAWRDFQQCGTRLIDYGYSDVRLFKFYFSKKSMHLTSRERANLDKIAEYASLDPSIRYIKINSHTDSRGIRRINLAVSQKRANMIKKYLVKKGVDSSRFVIVATGEKKPKYNNRTKSGRAKNRRVEVRLVK